MTGPALPYTALLRLPGVRGAFAAAALGRLAYAALPLALLLTVQRATSSYTTAGAALGAFGISTATAPVKTRLVARFGAHRALPPFGIAYAATLLVVVAVAVSGVRSTPVYVGLGIVAGLAAPLLGPVMRGIWRSATVDGMPRQRAYSLDTVTEECLYVLGPVVVAADVAFTRPALALAGSAVLALLGTLWLGTAAPGPAARNAPAPAPDPHPWWAPLRYRGFRSLLAAMAGAGLGLGTLDVAVTARATRAGHPAAAGWLIAALSVGSVAGGLAWGRLHHRRRTSTQLGVLAAALAAGLAAAALAPNLLVLGAVLVGGGLALSPTLVVAFLASDRLVPAPVRAEAATWVTTANNVAIALGASLAGRLVDGPGPRTTLLLGAAALALTALAVMMGG